MTLSHLTRAARLYLRAELMTARIRMRSEAQRLMLLALAGGLALLALILVNVALYAALLSVWGPVWTPLALALADLVLAGLALVAASRQKPGPELAVAEEIRALAGEALEEQVQQGFSVQGLLGNMGANVAGARTLLPLVTTLIGVLRRGKKGG